MKTYIQQIKEKTIELNEKSFDDFVEFWHKSPQSRNISLHEAIGLTWEEYSKNILSHENLIKLIEGKVKEI